MSRRTIVAGNWMMNLDRTQARELTTAVAARRGAAPSAEPGLWPPAPAREPRG